MTYDEYMKKYGQSRSNKNTASSVQEEKENTGAFDRYMQRYGDARQERVQESGEDIFSRLERFESNYHSYWDSAVKNLEDVNYANASSLWADNTKASEALRNEADGILRSLHGNVDRYNPESYKAAVDYLTQVGYDLDKIGEEFSNSRRYYGKWDTEEDYNAYIRNQEMQEEDPDALRAELKDLEDQRAALIQAFDDADVVIGNEAGDLESQKFFKDLEEYDAQIAEKRQYLKQVLEVQRPVAENERYQQMLSADPDALKAELKYLEDLKAARIQAFDDADVVIGTEAGDLANQAFFKDLEKYDAQITEKRQYLNKVLEVQEWTAANEEYQSLMSAEDFAEKSKYVSTANGRERSAMEIMMDSYSAESSGWDDPLYEYINGNKEAGVYLSDMASTNYGPDNALGSFYGRSTENNAQSQQMTKDEVAIFNYLYATQGKEAAHAYYDHLQSPLNARQRAADEAYAREYARESPVPASVFTVLMSPLKGLSYMGQVSDYLDDGRIDQNAQYNKFSYMPTAIRGQVSQMIEESGKWGKVGSFAYNTGMSMGDFLMTTAVTGGNGTASMLIMGSGAAADTTIAAKDRGLSDEQAFQLGTVSGLAEVLCERVSLGALLDGDLLRDSAGKYILKNMIAEGLEEVTTSGVNLVADILISKDQSQWQQSINGYMELGYDEETAFGMAMADQAMAMGLDFLGGFFSGGVISSVGVGFNKLGDRSGSKQIDQGSAPVGTDGVQQRTDRADVPHTPGPEAPVSLYDDAPSAQETAGQEISAEDPLWALAQEVAVDQREAENARQEDLDGAETAADAREDIGGVREQTQSEGIYEAVEDAPTVQGQQTVEAASDPVWEAAHTVARETRQQQEAPAEEQLTDAQPETVPQTKAAEKERLIYGKYTGIREIQRGKVLLDVFNGDVNDSSKMDPNWHIELNACKLLSRIRDHIDIDTGNQLLGKLAEHQYAVEVASVRGMEQAYNYGYAGYDRSAMEGKNTMAALVPEDVRNILYDMGAQYRQTVDAGKAKGKTKPAPKPKTVNVKADQNIKPVREDSGKHRGPDESRYEKVRFEGNISRWGKKQQAEVEFVEFVAKNFSGNRVYVYESYKNADGKYVYTDSAGRVQKAHNGVYVEKNGDIYLDLNAGNHSEGLVLNTFAHELYHHIEMQAPEQAKALAEFIAKELGEETVEAAVNRQIKKARKAGYGEGFFEEQGMSAEEARQTVRDRAYSDFIADGLETMFTKGDVVQKLADLHRQDKGLSHTIRKFIRKWVSKLREFYNAGNTLSIEGRLVAELETFDKIQQMFAEALKIAGENFQAQKNTAGGGGVDLFSLNDNSLTPGAEGAVVNQNGDPVAYATSDGTVMLSTRTYEEEGRDTFRKYLQKCVTSNKLTKLEMQEMLDGIEEIYEVCKEFKDKFAPFSAWSDASVARDTHGRPVFSVVTPNGDYKMNLDFSLVCKKRRTLDAVFNEMSRRGIIDDFELGQKSVVKINEIIRKYGLETACALCFVDAKRFRQASMADSFTRLYNELVESLVPEEQKGSIGHFNFGGYSTVKKVEGGIDTWDNSKLDFSHINHVLKTYGNGTVEYKTAKYIKTHPEGRKLLLRGDFMSSQGFDAVKTQNKDILKLYNSKKGTGGPKAAFGDVQYMNEIIQKARYWTPAKAYAVGGVRIQSFSDYVPRMVFDYVQMVYDLAATKLPAHAYTKESLFVKQFGLTGIKINMSLIPAIAEGGIAPGLDANGDYVWAGESFDYETAKQIQNAEGYTENCGTICVGVSYEHIKKLLNDPNIRMVIPYHKSGLNPIVAHMNKIAEFTDYTNDQRTKGKDGKALSKDFDFSKAIHDMGENASPKAVADQYLKWCVANGYTARFAEFAAEENYYKLLEDFTLYDKDGNYVPQREVRAVFPKETDAFGSMKDLIHEGLEEDAIVEGKRDKNLSAIVDEIQRTLPKTEAEIAAEQVEQADRALFSERDTESVSNRSLLANALDSVAQDESEKRRLAEYREAIGKLEGYEKHLAELKEQIRELSFGKGPRDMAKIRALKDEAIKTANRIGIYDKKLLRLEGTKTLERLLNRETERVRQLEKQRWQESKKKAVSKVQETADKRDAKAKLQKLVLDTAKWIAHPAKTDIKCPDLLKQPYSDFLNSIDMSSDRLSKGGDPTKNDLRLANAMGSLATAIEKIMSSQDPSQDSVEVLDAGYLDLPTDFVQKLRELTENVKEMMVEGEYVVNNMSAADVRQLSQMIRTLNNAIKTVSTLYANLRFANARELGAESMGYMDSLGEIGKTGGIRDFVQWENALPYYVFKRFGKGGESIFEGLMDAQDKHAFLAKEIFDFQEVTWKGSEAKQWSEDSHTIDLPDGDQLTLTTADAMSIYCLSRRQHGLQHLLGGGVRVLGRKKGSRKAGDSRSTLTIKDIDAIITTLTDRQKKVAEAMQEFMSTTCAEWGNEISMKRFLTREFNEKNYFPIESNDENLSTKDPAAQQSDLFRLLNISATKAIDPRANNEVIIRNVFDVFTGHASDMARLNAYGMALLDYMKWLNYREKTTNENGQITVRGVRKSMEKAFGNAAGSYVLNLIKDVNGRPSDNGDPTILMKWMRSAKTASVGSSLRVATLQITSYPRAALVLSPKNLILGLTKVPRIERAKKYCGIALWKSFGFYDTNISRSIEEQLKGVKNIKQKLIDLSLKGAEIGDAITWGAMWNACEYEIAATKKYKVGTDEFYQAVGKKLREVVYRTQVVDSMLTRSQMMRSKRGMTQEASAFMSEPTLSANILMDAGLQFSMEKRRTGSSVVAWRKTGKYVTRAVAVYSVGQLAAALMEGMWDAWRDDEDEEFSDKFVSAFTENLVLDLVPFNKIPIISDAFEAALAMFDVGFYSSDRMSTTWLTQAVAAVDAWKDVLGGKSSVTAYSALYKTMRAISSCCGVSLSGVMREGVALWNNTAGSYDVTWKILTYDRSKAEKGELLLDALMDGNDRQADSLKAQFADEAEYQNALRGAIKERFLADGMDSDTAIRNLVEYVGLDEDKAYWKVEEWKYENETGEDFVKYGEFFEAVQTGKNLRTVIKRYTDNGVEASTLATQITTHFKPIYMDMSRYDRAGIKGYLLNAFERCGVDRQTAETKIANWTFEADHPELVDQISYTQYRRWETDGKPKGVPIEMFTDVAEFRDDGTSASVKNQEEVGQYIMSITDDDKLRDALWCCFYKASTLNKAPWN